MSANKWELLAALPFLAAAGGILYVAALAAGGSALRLRRRHKQRRQQPTLRHDTGVTPWSEWLREINEKAEKTTDRAR
jgi:hypothetical protein